MSVRRLTERLLQDISYRMGYELAPLPPRSERLDVHLLKLFGLLKINCVIDVGANRGQYGRFLRTIGYAGQIFSFEPSSKDFKILRQHADVDENWEVYPLALGAENIAKQMNVASDSVFNSFLNPNEFMLNQGLRIDSQEKVEMHSLDNLFPQLLVKFNSSSPQVYLKIDTQGYDLEVLAGARESLKNIVALQTEISIKPVYETMPTLEQSFSTLQQLGYEITGLYPVARDNALRVVELDCIAVRGDTAGPSITLQKP